MSIAVTDLHRKAMIEQAQIGVLNLQHSVAENAATHKKWAIDGMPLEELQEKIDRTLDAYESIRARLRHFRDVVIPSDACMLEVGDALRLTLVSVGQVGQDVANLLVDHGIEDDRPGAVFLGSLVDLLYHGPRFFDAVDIRARELGEADGLELRQQALPEGFGGDAGAVGDEESGTFH